MLGRLGVYWVVAWGLVGYQPSGSQVPPRASAVQTLPNELGNAGTDDTENGLIGWWSNVAVTFVNNHGIQPSHETVGRSTFPWGAPEASVE